MAPKRYKPTKFGVGVQPEGVEWEHLQSRLRLDERRYTRLNAKRLAQN